LVDIKFAINVYIRKKNMLQKLLSGGAARKTRLHDEKGNLISFNRFFLNGSRAVFTGLMRILLGYRVAMPWISYSAISVLKQHLDKTSRVLEFGSGMSTIWYAQHAGHVCSVEDNKEWYEKVQELIQDREIQNIDYLFADTEETYSQFKCGDDVGYDLIMVDGSFRSSCVANTLKLLKPSGILYLDNSDKDSTESGGDMRLAESQVLSFAKQQNAEVIYFTDFAPTQLFVQQGLMIKLIKNKN